MIKAYSLTKHPSSSSYSMFGHSHTHHKLFTIKENMISRFSQNMWNFFSSFDSSKFKESGVVLNSLSDKFNWLGFGLSLNDNTLFIFSGLFDNVLCSFGNLLSDLFSFNSFTKLFTEGQMSDGHIIKIYIEGFGSLFKGSSDLEGDLISLGEQLRSSKLSNNSSQDFINEGWHDSFVEFGTN